MKLSQATSEQKLKAAAELDGVTVNTEIFGCYNVNGIVKPCIPSYDTDYNAIIPLIQKQPKEVRGRFANTLIYFMPDSGGHLYSESPSQLLDALLIATGKMTI